MKKNYSKAVRTLLHVGIMLVGLLGSQLAIAQTYLLPTTGTTTVTTCAGNLYDNGGATGAYSANATGGTTLLPATAGNKIRLQFNQFDVDPYYDAVLIYDGSSVSAPLIGTFTNYNLPSVVYATNTTGSLTVVLQSDAYYNSAGFTAAISCVTTVPQADLAVQGASAIPLSTVAGNAVSLSCAIYNLGGVAATSSNVGYYFSSDATLDANDQLLGYSTGGTLGVGLSSSRYTSVTIPATATPGSYYILFVGDYLSQVSESNEQNNTASVNITVTAPSIDLTIQQAGVTPLSTAVGTPINMSCYIANTGNATSASSSVGFYISTDATLSASDQLLTAQYGGALTTTYTSSRYGTAAIPPGLTPGTYYILFVADYQNQVTESNETNNVTAVAITVAPAGVDLVVQQQQLYPSSVAAGGSVQASASVLNQGNVTATSSGIGYYLSTNQTLDANDVLLTSVVGGQLAANGTSYRSSNLTVPTGTAAGNYYVLFVADPQSLVTETNETNNVQSVALVVIAPSIDLYVSSAYATPTSVSAGGSVSVSCYLENQGNTQANPANLGFYLSTDNVFSANDVSLGSLTGASIAGYGYLSRYSTVTVPTGTAPGTYYLLFVADPQNVLGETNETNNVTSTTIQVIAPGIDLQMSSAYVSPYTVSPGSTVSLSSYIYNTGTLPASSSTTGYYLSTNATLDANDVLLTTLAGSQLGAGQSSYVTTTGTVPTGTAPGYYYVLFVADPQNAVTETNETNNIVTQSIQVVAPNIDLYVSSAYATPTSVSAGGSVSVSCYLENQGNTQANPANLGFYLSTDNVFSANDVSLGSLTGASIAGYGYLSRYSTVTVPTGTAAGTYYLLFVADPQNVLTETNETNNVTSTTIQVIAPGIDLQMSSAYVSPYTVGAGSAVSLTSYIYNTGTLAASSSTTGYYLSTNATLDANDVLLTTLAGSQLGAGQSSYVTTTGTVPTGTAPGYYYVLFVADPQNAVTETNETNNIVTQNIQVVAPSIDLQVTQIYLNSGTISPGISTPVTAYVYNAGNTSSPSSDVTYYMSTNTTLDVNDVLLDTVLGGSLTAGMSNYASTSIMIPTATTAGTYYLLAVVDPQNAVTETNEANNVTYYQFTVTGPFTGTVVPYSGSNTVTTCSTTVYDHAGYGSYSDGANGTLTIIPGTTNSRIQLTFNSFSVEQCCDRLTIYDGPNAQSPVLASLYSMPTQPIVATNAAGVLTLVFYSDGSVTGPGFDAAVTCLTATSQVPDLTSAQLTVSATSVPAGTSFNTSIALANQGTASASSVAIGYYLSTNATLDASDALLTTNTSTATLTAGQTATRTVAAPVPSTTLPGNYYLLAVIDPQNAIGESDETNNVTALAVTVTLGTATHEQTGGYTLATYPNPVANGQALQVHLNGAGTVRRATLTLLNSVGQEVRKEAVTLNPGADNRLSVSHDGLASGLYTMRLVGENLNVVRTVVFE